jgi:hypothetical protein
MNCHGLGWLGLLWFGKGFGAINLTMEAEPYSIIVDGTGAVTERSVNYIELKKWTVTLSFGFVLPLAP